MKADLICSGCGATLQSENEEAVGYIPKSALDREQLLCQRCFQLRHYNKNVTVSIDSDDFLKMVSSIYDKEGIVVHLIDIFDVNGTLLSNLRRIVGDKKVFLVVNKIDVLPKSTNFNKLMDWLEREVKQHGLDVEKIFLISAKKDWYVNDLAMALEKERNKQDIYVVGVTNVGKSTFINQLIERSTQMKNAITTSYFPGTTLNFIRIPLDKNSSMIDTPGIVNKKQITHYVSNKDLKIIVPKKEIKPRNYQLNAEQTLFFGGLARLDYIKGKRQTFVSYFSNDLMIHRTKWKNADTLYERHVGKMLSPPNEETLKTLPKLVKQSFRITEPDTDIVFSGLGWVTVVDGNATVDVYYPQGLSVSLRRSFY